MRKKRINPHPATERIRERILKEAKRVGVLTNKRACAIVKSNQVWYHLTSMAKAGMLKHAGFNQWTPK